MGFIENLGMYFDLILKPIVVFSKRPILQEIFELVEL